MRLKAVRKKSYLELQLSINNPKFASHVENIFTNLNLKMHALPRIPPYMSLTKKSSLLKMRFLYPSSAIALLHGCAIQEH